MSGLVRRFQRLQAYERECGGAVLASLDSVPDAHRGEPAIQKALNLAAHVQAARAEWLARLTGSRGVDALFFERAELGDVERMTAEADEKWERFLDELTEAELDRLARYTNMKGHPQECLVADILTHVVNHASYHRGQIAVLVAQAGGAPAVTDFIFYAYREPESP